MKTFRTTTASEIELDEVALSAAELARLTGDCTDLIEVGGDPAGPHIKLQIK